VGGNQEKGAAQALPKVWGCTPQRTGDCGMLVCAARRDLRARALRRRRGEVRGNATLQQVSLFGRKQLRLRVQVLLRDARSDTCWPDGHWARPDWSGIPARDGEGRSEFRATTRTGIHQSDWLSPKTRGHPGRLELMICVKTGWAFVTPSKYAVNASRLPTGWSALILSPLYSCRFHHSWGFASRLCFCRRQISCSGGSTNRLVT